MDAIDDRIGRGEAAIEQSRRETELPEAVIERREIIGTPDALIAAVSRVASAGKLETETADDFVTTSPIPNQFTGGEGPVTGEEVRFDLTFTTPFDHSPECF